MCDTSSNRHRRVRVETDDYDIVRCSTQLDTVATVTVGSVDGGEARIYDDPSVRLTVQGDGTWRVTVAGPGWGNRPTVVAEGHIDHTGAVAS